MTMTPALPKRKPGPVPLEGLAFENTFVRDLPGDAVLTNVPRQAPGASYTPVQPTPVAAPKLLAWSDELARIPGNRASSFPGGARPETGCCPA